MNPRILFALALLSLSTAARAGSIVDTPHNLSATGPGAVRATDEDRVCIFCHTPHGSRTNAPLWNRRDSSATYLPYDSPTLTAQPGQPTGSSKLCLSCHDGTVGLGDLVSESTPIAIGGSPTMPAGPGLIGTDLRDDHPISFSYTDALGGTAELAPPNSWHTAIRLDAAGMMQCTTCHNPHDNDWGQFLVMGNSEAALCRECHTISGFDETSHATSTNTWSGSGTDPWPHTAFDEVASNACLNCHRSHHAPGREELLTAARHEDVCLNCHDGGVAQTDIAASFRKAYRHPVVETSGTHSPGEVLTGTADHVTCADCHNPHKAVPRDADPPNVPGVLEGVSGLTAGGTFIAEANFEYEVCFKCHADDPGGVFGSIPRQISANSILREFAPGSPAYHPVVSPGLNPDVPSLIAPLQTDSMISCGDCHGDDAAGGSAPAGPHGSNFRFLLTREYRTDDGTAESPTAYALCYSCHDRASILANESFPAHRRHIVDENTSCSACHDPHGIDPTEGNATNNAAMINFDLSVVAPLPATGLLEFRSTGTGTGECSLRCHNADHDARGY